MNYFFSFLAKILPFLLVGSVAFPADQDPYQRIEHLRLPNGLQLILAPSDEATLTSVRLEVKVGWEAETAENRGVSHLLEHVLFRDKKLKDQMTYLQVIQEAGGEANGETEARRTSFFGSIPSTKGLWLFDKISHMILHPSLVDEYVEKEKGTVELERGRPGPITLALGFNPIDYLHPKFLRYPSFWQTEFHLDYQVPYTLSQEQLATRRLRTWQVQKHYRDYYYPANMVLYVAGKFNRAQLLKHIHDTWDKVPATSGLKMTPRPLPIARRHPYKRLAVTDGTPRVYIGTKGDGVNLQEESVLRSYTEYLAHRLMKEVRNVKGQTYTASAKSSYDHGAGYSYVRFQTPKEHFRENLQLVKNYIRRETTGAGLSADQVSEAKRLYLSEYELMGQEADNMMDLAMQYDSILEETGHFESPYAALMHTDAAGYNQVLRKYFTPERSYQRISEPNFLFPYDYSLLYALIAIFSFMGLRAWLTKPFPHDRIQWLRKLRYPPLKIMEACAALLIWYLCSYVDYALMMLFRSSALLQSSILTSQYLYAALFIFAVIGIAQGVFSLLPRKLMVVDGALWIKSLTYFSRQIPLEQISRVEAKHWFTCAFPGLRWFGSAPRWAYFNPFFWQKGLLVRCQNGRSYFFSVTAAEKAQTELHRLLEQNRQAPSQKQAS